jgi:DNA-directed RNA polymerase specialized sigma24 family protein
MTTPMHPLILEFVSNKMYKADAVSLAKWDGNDLFQEVALILLQKPPEKLTMIWDSGGSRWYIQKLMWNTYHGKRQLFDRVYRDKLSRVDFDTWSMVAVYDNTLDDKVDREKYHDAFLECVGGLNEVEKQTIQLSMFYKSTREFSNFSGIPYKTLSTNIKQIREKLKAEILKRVK